MRVYDNFQATPNTQPGVSVTTPSGPGPGQVAAEQGQRLGNALMGAGQQGAKVFEDIADQANQVRVNDAMNQARLRANTLAYDPTSGYTNLKGNDALTRPDGQALPDEYGGKLQDSISEIANSLGNDRQKLLFRQQADALLTGFKGDAERHMAQEFHNYAISTQEGTLALAADAAKRNWQDPDKVAGALESAKAAVVEKGRLSGWAAAQTDAAREMAVSKVHHDVIMSALENNNPAYALGYLERNREQMTADDILRVQGQVNQNVWAQVSSNAVAQTSVEFQPKVMPTDFDRMKAITYSTESNNNPNAVGRYVPGQGTAKGINQVMDATNLDPGFGVRPAADNSPAERKRVGDEYLAAMLKRYGDPAKAWAAYNWGPGNLDKALADQAKNRAGSQGADWLAYVPKETQDYVVKNMNALQGGGGIVARPVESDFVNAALSRLPPGAPPQLVKLTREQAVQQFGIINKSVSERGQAVLMQAQQWLNDNNGDLAHLPTSMRADINQYAPDKMDDLTKFAKVVARGENVTNMPAYLDATAHPEELARMSDQEFQHFVVTNFSQADGKHIAKLRQDELTGKSDMSAGGFNATAFNSTVDNRLQAVGVNPKPKPNDTEGRGQVATIKKYLTDGIYAQQRQLDRKMTPQEIGDFIDRTMQKDLTFRSTFLGVPVGSSNSKMLTMKVGDIPSESVDQIKAALAKRGVTNPTDDQILRTYWTAKNG